MGDSPIRFWTTRGEYGCFSNFSKHPINYHGVICKTSEHLYQALKMTNGDDFQKVVSQKTPKESKIMAHSLPILSNWETIKYSTMKKVLTLKTMQNPEVMKILINTGDKTIEEDSPYDYIWGIGEDGSGLNLLGKAWMDVRSQINYRGKIT